MSVSTKLIIMIPLSLRIKYLKIYLEILDNSVTENVKISRPTINLQINKNV